MDATYQTPYTLDGHFVKRGDERVADCSDVDMGRPELMAAHYADGSAVPMGQMNEADRLALMELMAQRYNQTEATHGEQ